MAHDRWRAYPHAIATHASIPNLASLRALCVAADAGTLGRAALRLHTSQPALSKRLQGLEALVGVELLERSPHGVKLTPAGRRLYEQAHRLLEHADEVTELMVGLSRTGGPVRLAASHSAAEAFVAEVLGELDIAVELLAANSQVVRSLVADGRAEVGVAASRPNATPSPAVRELPLAEDAIVCAVPPGHRWAGRARVAESDFLRTPLVVRDPQSNARWTVEAVLRERGLPHPPLVAEAATPRAALTEARTRKAPVLLSRHVIARSDFVQVEIGGLAFPRDYKVVLPAVGEPTRPTRELVDAIREHVRIWLR